MDPRQRERWGCDAPAPIPVFGITCPNCDGAKGYTSCPTCEGRGNKLFYRCPASMVSSDSAGLARAFSAYDKGILPDPGGFYDQTACFVHAMALMAAEQQRILQNERPKNAPDRPRR